MTHSRLLGLIYKEYILLRGSMALYGKLMIFYWLLSGLGLYPISMTVGIGQIILIFAPLSLFFQEERFKFQEYLLNLPDDSKNMVKSRYLTICFVTLGVTMLNLLFIVFWQLFTKEYTEKALLSLAVSTIFAILIQSLALPLFYSLPCGKARPWFFLLILTPLSIYVIFRKTITNSISNITAEGGFFALFGGLFLLVALVLQLGFCSYLKSVKIMKMKYFP